MVRYFSNRREKMLNHIKKTFLFIILNVLFHNATQAQEITLLSQLDTGGAAFGVDYKDDFVYVAAWSNDLTIVDAADPYNPSIIGNVGFDGSGRKVRIFGDYAYVTGSYGIHIVDISNPFEVSVAGEFIRSSPGGVYPHGVDVKDGKCYISFNAMGLYIVDVSNPENPVELGHFDALDWARDVVVVDSLAYLLNLNNGGGFSDALQYLQILNISDPNNIYEVGNWIGSNVYAWSNSLIVREDHAYVLGDHGLFILDITDPTSPQTVGVWNPGGWNFRMSEDGDLLYIAKEGGGMKVVDVSDPTNPSLISTFSTIDYCADVAPRDSLVYIADADGGLLIAQHTFAPVSIDNKNGAVPQSFHLDQNYPNPFNPVTTLRYDLPENSLVNITIYDMLGREVKTLINQTQNSGYKSLIWDATNDYGEPVSAGLYLYRIRAGDFRQTKKMVLLK
jgi:hypothetical protein